MIVSLDATVTSRLEWDLALDDGPITWHLDMGLFSQLPKDLDDSGQIETLKLGLTHFLETVWSRFADRTDKVILYRGALDFSLELGGDPLECRRIVGRFFDRLAEALPDEVPLVLEVDASSINDPLLQAHLLSRPDLDRFSWSVTGARVPCCYTGSETHALLLPLDCSRDSTIGTVLNWIATQTTSWRLIDAHRFTMEWDGLDEALILPNHVTPDLERALRGFASAGGRITPWRG